MGIIETLTPAERARQLREPEGAVGLAVAHWNSENNKAGNEKTVAELGIEAGNRVLEIGFGDGRTVRKVIAQAADVQYTGIDISPTMVEEATRVNAEFIATGRASFVLGSAERMPFDDNTFDRVFSIGVIHFWTAPEVALAEVRRVLRAGGRMLMGCLAPQGAPAFARPEYGFYLREADAWDRLCCAAGFSDIKVEDLIFEQRRADGTPIQLHVVHMEALA
jgi:ubiquinone/menaquinone biosynthesis C-methylase UbiE